LGKEAKKEGQLGKKVLSNSLASIANGEAAGHALRRRAFMTSGGGGEQVREVKKDRTFRLFEDGYDLCSVGVRSHAKNLESNLLTSNGEKSKDLWSRTQSKGCKGSHIGSAVQEEKHGKGGEMGVCRLLSRGKKPEIEERRWASERDVTGCDQEGRRCARLGSQIA